MEHSRGTLITTIGATIAAWAVWFFVIIRMDPIAGGTLTITLFHTALLIAVSGSATIVGLVVRRGEADRRRILRIAVRQGFLIGIGVTIAIFLQSRTLLTWVNTVFLIAALTLLELFIISLRHELPDAPRDYKLTA